MSGEFETKGYIRVPRGHGANKSGPGIAGAHRIVASRAIGRILPSSAEVHHVNGIRNDNRPSNLVICENRAFHHLLHRRAESLRQLGHPNGLRCRCCGRFDIPENLWVYRGSKWPTPAARHAECHNRVRRERFQRTGRR